MESKPKYQQLSVLAAGVFTNTILAILFFIILAGFFLIAYNPVGATFTTYSYASVPLLLIDQIGGKDVIDTSNEGIISLIKENNLTDDLELGSEGNFVKYTKIKADGKDFYIDIESFTKQLQTNSSNVYLFWDFPAINAGLGSQGGIIVEINGITINDYNALVRTMKTFKPGEIISVITKDRESKKLTE